MRFGAECGNFVVENEEDCSLRSVIRLAVVRNGVIIL